MPTPADIGELSYNGYTFGPLTHVDVAGDFVYDDAERAVLYTRYRVTANAVIAYDSNHASQDDHLEAIRQRLSKPGREFKLEDKGFGPSIHVNGSTSGIPRDVNFGPKPRILTWTPIGNTEACQVTWQCEVCVPECDDAATSGLESINYAVRYSVDAKGFTTRTITGHLTIAITRKLGDYTAIPDTADAYRDRLGFIQPVNFQRTVQEFNLSADKKRLDFTITDVEIASPNGWPAGVTNISGVHKARVNKHCRPRKDNSLTVDIELAQNQPRLYAWSIFRYIWQQRVSPAIIAGQTVMFEYLDIEEQLFANRIVFNAGWRVLGKDVQEIITSSGLFGTLNIGWGDWFTSMDAITGPTAEGRGLAQMSHNKAEDQLVDLCEPLTENYSTQVTQVVVPAPSTPLNLCNAKPTAAKSWVHFQAYLTQEDNYDSLHQTTLGDVTITPQQIDPTVDKHKLTLVDVTDIETAIAAAGPHMRWRWTGYCQRMGYTIPDMEILTVGGVQLKLESKIATRKHDGEIFCQNIYSMAWDYLYRVVEQPPELSDGDGQEDPNNDGSNLDTPDP